MANFMGPMAPPQAAQPQPAQLDIKTNPSQRAQFKSFMQGMSVPPTTAPIAPMLPAPMPSPMDQVDIFAAAPMASGGVVGGLNKLGEMSGQMVEALDTVVYGGGQGGGFNGGMSSGGGFGGGQMPPPLPMTQIGIGPFKGGVSEGSPRPAVMPGGLSLNDSALLGMPTPSYMPMDPDGDGMDQSGRPMESQLSDEQLEAMKAQMMGLRSSAGNQGSAFGAGSMGSPFARLSGLGSFGSVFGYEDGGPVGMANGGGVTFKSGRSYETGRGIAEQNREMDAAERAQTVDNIQAAISASTAGRQADADRYQAMADFFLDDAGNIPALSADAQSYIKETGTPAVNPLSIVSASGAEDMVGDSGAFVPPAGSSGSTDAAFNPRDEINVLLSDPMDRTPPPYGGPEIEAVAGRSVDPIVALDLLDLNADPNALSPAEELAMARGNPPTPGPFSDNAAIEQGGIFAAGPDIEGASTPEGRMAALASGRVDQLGVSPPASRLRDLESRAGGGLKAPGVMGMLKQAAGGLLSSNIAKNVFAEDEADRRTGVLNENNQIIGYVSPGFIPGTEVYTGRPGYNPFGSNAGVTFDSEAGAYRVTANPIGFDSPDPQYDEEQRNRLRAAQAADQTQPPAAPPPPNMITRPDDPLIPTPPPDVVVPSPRDPVNIGGAPVLTSPLLTAPNIDPVQSVELPQSFLDLLANFNRPAPRAMQDGGAVLDKAAGDFLEALRVA